MNLQINLTTTDKSEIIIAAGYKVKPEVRVFPSRYGGDDYKAIINFVYDSDGNLATPALDRGVEKDYYVDLVITELMSRSLVTMVKNFLLLNQK